MWNKVIGFQILCISVMSCAKFVPPTGGDRDIIPPKLVDSIPKNKATNYNGKVIWLKFDEYIDSKDLKQELIITPQPDTKYQVKNKGDEVTLNFEDRLDSNTTYTFNFGGGIKDINERNKSDQIKLVFSTGDKLDSLRITGSTNNLFTKKPVIDATVALYDTQKKDSLPIFSRKPTYFVKADSSGTFQFENLKSGTYKILAFTDANKNIRFDNKKELFGFKADTIILNRDTSSINIDLYPFDTIAPKYKRYVQNEKVYTLKFDEPIYRTTVRFNTDSVSYDTVQDEIRFFRSQNMVKDSIAVEISVADSLSNVETFQHTFIFREPAAGKSQNVKRDVVQFQVKPPSGKLIREGEKIELTFDFPVEMIDTSKIEINDDTLSTVKYKATYYNTSQTKVLLEMNSDISRSVVVNASSGAFVNSNLDSTTAFTLTYPIVKINETGVLAGSVKTSKTDSAQYIFQLVNVENGKIEDEQISTTEKFEFKNVLPNQYLIRAIIDENFNGLWDTAKFHEGTEPEEIILLKNPIKVKANFEFRDIIIEN